MNVVTTLLVILVAAAPLSLLPVIRKAWASPAFSRLGAALAALWIGWAAGALALGAVEPILLYVLAAIVGTVVAISYWRGRAAYGRVAGLPPGSLALSQTLLAIVDRDYYLHAASRYGPVFKMSQFHRPTVCIVGLERGHRLFREHRDSFGPVSQPFNQSVAGGFLRYMDVDTHGVYARLFGRALALPALAPTTGDIDAVCRRVLGTMADACHKSPERDIAPRVYCEQFSHDAFLRVLFGINPGTPGYEQFNTAYSGLRSYNIGTRVDRDTERSLQELREFLGDRARSLAADPASIPPCTLSELHRLDSDMPDRVCVDNLLFILKISSANVASLLLWLLKMLGGHPKWSSRIATAASETDDVGEPALIDSVVKETLRLAQSEYLYRRLLENVEFEGMKLPRGWLVRLCVRESHASDAAFTNPREFDPSRFLQRQSAVREFAPFGYGAHGCNGIAMNDVICRSFLHTLCADFDWSITRDGPLERGLRHWSHWQPSSALRIGIRARGVPMP